MVATHLLLCGPVIKQAMDRHQGVGDSWSITCLRKGSCVAPKCCVLSRKVYNGNIDTTLNFIQDSITFLQLFKKFWSKIYCPVLESAFSASGHGSSNKIMTQNIPLKVLKMYKEFEYSEVTFYELRYGTLNIYGKCWKMHLGEDTLQTWYRRLGQLPVNNTNRFCPCPHLLNGQKGEPMNW